MRDFGPRPEHEEQEDAVEQQAGRSGNQFEPAGARGRVERELENEEDGQVDDCDHADANRRRVQPTALAHAVGSNQNAV